MAERAKQSEKAREEAWAELGHRVGPSVESLRQQGAAALQRILGDDGHRAGARSHRPVELCERPAHLPGAEALGLQHWWLRGEGFEAGMGERGGGVPGRAGQNSPKTWRTSINDHTGEGDMPGVTCRPVAALDPRWANVDEPCLREQMTVGRDTGRWTPPQNDCQEVVLQALHKCHVEGPAVAQASEARVASAAR